MENLKINKISVETIIVALLFIFIIISSLNSAVSQYKNIGLFAIYIILFMSFILLGYYTFKNNHININIFYLNVLVFIMSFIMIIGIIIYPVERSLIVFGQFIGCMSFLLFAVNIYWNDLKYKSAFYLCIILGFILPFIGDISFIGPHYIFILFFILIFNISKIFKIILTLFCIYFIYISGARALLILLIFSLITYFVWIYITKYKYLFYFYYFFIVSILVSIIFIYPKIIYWKSFGEINEFVMKYTGQRLMSGRESLWIIITDLIEKKPLLGYGTGMSPSRLIERDLSSHNLYLQITFQNGFLGLVIFLTIFFLIWRIFYFTKSVFSTRLVASFFIGIMVYYSFEVGLTQNRLDVALMFWLIISIGISNYIYKRKA